MSDWDNLEGFEAWSAELRNLVEQAKTLGNGDEAALGALVAKLNSFVGCSVPNYPEIIELDEIASELAMDLIFGDPV